MVIATNKKKKKRIKNPVVTLRAFCVYNQRDTRIYDRSEKINEINSAINNNNVSGITKI